MNFALRTLLVFTLFLRLAPIRSFGQAELVEELKRLVGEVADLRDANSAQNRRMSQMQKEIDALREAVRESHEKSITRLGDFPTREDLKRVVDSVREVDSKRESDRKLILEELEKLAHTMREPAERVDRSPSRRNTSPGTGTKEKEKQKDPEPERETGTVEGTFLPYTVLDGQRLSDILKEYNGALKEKGLPPVTLEDVKRANPKLNINKIYSGQKLLLPVPEKKKK